jgi:alkylation response protein AidB-like acyl-CoA dehydrogenase
MSASFLDDDVADEIWGKDPRGVVAWGPGKSQAVREDDGFRVNARCAFASGARHATWLGTHATIVDADGEPVVDDNGKRTVRTMLIPADKIVYEDIWNVVGMRGTASDGFVVDNVFVPHKYTLSRDNPEERRSDRSLYLFRQTNLYAAGFSGVAMGIAQAMIDAFAELALHKTPRHSKSVLNQSPVVQSDFARASVRLNAARTFLLSELDDIWANVLATGELTVAQRMRIRLATTHGIHEAKAAADTIYEAVGATAIFNDGPYERRFRDLHTLTQQAQGKKAHYETVGAYLLGDAANLAAV